MKLTILKSIVLALITTSSITAMGTETNHKTDTLSNPVEVIAHVPIVGLKIASGIAAVPLMIVGEIGSLSGQAGESLWEAANRPIGDTNQNSETNKGVNFKK
jgi:hypothetical protein